MYIGVIFFSLAWFFLYRLNGWLFSQEITSHFASWIFLPQIVRLIAVLICGWRGAIGLFVGALLTGDYSSDSAILHSIVLAFLSSIGAYIAVYFFLWWARLPDTLSGLKGRHLWQLALLGAIFNSIPTNTYLFFSGLITNWWMGVLPMLSGDWFGSAIMLYVMRLTQKLWSRYSIGNLN